MPIKTNKPYNTAIGISFYKDNKTKDNKTKTFTSNGERRCSWTVTTFVRVTPFFVISSISDKALTYCGECGKLGVANGKPKIEQKKSKIESNAKS